MIKVDLNGLGAYPKYYDNYYKYVKGDNLIEELKTAKITALTFYKSLTLDQWNYAYAPNKWTVAQVVQHTIDTELIFCFRILAFARGEKQALPGFDENAYAAASAKANVDHNGLITLFEAQRNATIAWLNNLTAEEWLQTGNANGNTVTVKALAWLLVGHEIHHRGVIAERYL